MTDYRKLIIDKRKTLGISQRQLSFMVDIAQSHMNKIESGASGISIELLQKFCNVLDIEITFKKE